ncbi:substrate-binding domain-containing protein [Tardiphaga sp. 619_E2_N8_5]|jgi:molybdate transport repressor ModE-like protein|uniref:substrate-binding domain-containing protein n=1 Tax=unclassified Tardiphaga TaxID=2631404 RepID=UPI003F26EC6B
MRIDIETIWRFRKPGSRQPTSVMLGFLKDINETGKLTLAASRNQLSYRHAWSLVNDWSAFFGVPVVERSKGKGTKLTAFGEKLVWAGERLEARLGPQLDNLAQELATELKELLPNHPAVIRVHASHGFAVSKLREMLNTTAGTGIDLRYVSNQTSLVSLAHNTCDLAGVHLPRGELRKRSVNACKEWVDNRVHRVVGFATREMGLMVKPGNPLRITSMEALINPAIRFVNRDQDSGTGLLFDQLLRQHKIDPEQINGYQQVEFTHAAVAAYVASDMADVAFGVEAAARQFGLDFVRLLTEDYYFVCRETLLDQAPMQHILALLRSAEFHDVLVKLPGYAASDTGAIKTVNEVFHGKKS